MTADSLRKTHDGPLSIFFSARGAARKRRRGKACGNRNAGKDEEKKRSEKGEETGDHPVAISIRVNGPRTAVGTRGRKRKKERDEFRERITASSDVYLGPDYL